MPDSQRRDAELASRVATIQIPPLFDPAVFADRSRLPAAAEQLQAYGQLFQEYTAKRMDKLSQMKTEIEGIDLLPDKKLQALHELNNTYEIDWKLTQKYFDIVIEVSRQGIAFLDFMTQARYGVLDDRVMFDMEAKPRNTRRSCGPSRSCQNKGSAPSAN